MDDVHQLQRTLWAASQPLPLRALRSARRRLRERREELQRSLELQLPRQHDVVLPAASLGKDQRVAIPGDVGQHEYHVGDEAMAHAAIAELRKRGYGNFVVLTHDVGQTSELYGLPAAKRPEVPTNPFTRHQLLQEIDPLLPALKNSMRTAYISSAPRLGMSFRSPIHGLNSSRQFMERLRPYYRIRIGHDQATRAATG